MRRFWLSAIVLAAILVPASFGLAKLQRDNAVRALDQALSHEAVEQSKAFDTYFERARAVILLTGNIPAFRQFYEAPGTRSEKVAAHGQELTEATAALAYLEHLYPDSIGEACFIDKSGAENARVVAGSPAHTHELSEEEHKNDFFAPSFAVKPGQVYQTQPYVSPDTGDWVIANATPIPGGQAIVHFEVSIESFRKAATLLQSDYPIKVVDTRTGAVVIDSRKPQVRGAELGAPDDARFAVLKGLAGTAPKLVGDQRIAVSAVGGGAANANDWVVVAEGPRGAASIVSYFNGGPIGMVVVAGLLLLLSLVGARAGNLRSEANTDHLTGLANRRHFLTRLDQTVRSASANGRRSALMIIDLDRFKDLNDALGHHVGDRLLEEVGPRLRRAVGATGLIARLGGDEFAVVMPNISDADQSLQIAVRIRKQLNQPVRLEGMNLQVDASIGIAIYPDHGDEPGELLKRADIAMYKAKRAHTGTEFYLATEQGSSREQLALAGEFRDALRNGGLTVYYQPKADLRTGDVAGVEALVRWEHPTLGLLPPARFLGLVEQIGLMRQVTSFVLDAALHQVGQWLESGRRLAVSVNVGPADLLDEVFPDEVESVCERYGVPTDLLQLEVTENTIMSNPDPILHVLGRLAGMGITLSLDDYGTGHSSLSYLKRLPIHELKIDRSFVFNMDTDARDATIVRSTIDLAQSLDLRVVVEGVETEGTWNVLAEMGAEVGQGYLLARPLPAHELETWLAGRGALATAVVKP